MHHRRDALTRAHDLNAIHYCGLATGQFAHHAGTSDYKGHGDAASAAHHLNPTAEREQLNVKLARTSNKPLEMRSHRHRDRGEGASLLIDEADNSMCLVGIP